MQRFHLVKARDHLVLEDVVVWVHASASALNRRRAVANNDHRLHRPSPSLESETTPAEGNRTLVGRLRVSEQGNAMKS